MGEDSNLWRFRIEAAFREKQYWEQLKTDECDANIKDKAFSILVSSLGEPPLRNCQKASSDPMLMFHELDACYASRRAASRIDVLASVFSKRYDCKRPMS